MPPVLALDPIDLALRERRPAGIAPVTSAGKLLMRNGEPFYIRGVTYGTFAPDENGDQFPSQKRVLADFRAMAANGFNVVRSYTVPPARVLDAAAECRLQILAGLTWEQHVAFLDNEARADDIRRRVRDQARACAGHDSLFGFTVGNEIPASMVRWHGRKKVERFLFDLYDIAKTAAPSALTTYVNFPTTAYLELPFLDFAAFNVYLEEQEKLSAYLKRLQNIAGDLPLISFGMAEGEFRDFARSADLCLNVSAANPLPAVLSPRCVKAFLDTDPGYNQIVLSERPSWSTNVERWAAEFAHYDRYLTYAENIGADDCLVPRLGVDWIATRMPIVRDLWSNLPPAARNAPWSTVMTWNGFRGPLIHDGREYGSKDVEFAKIMSLPHRTKQALKIALGGAAPMKDLLQQGWTTVDGPTATVTPEIYRQFIAGSRGEVSTAKNVYVAMKTGWFSCRTACYLAAGRPAVVQDTGFSKTVPVGKGLFAFDTLEQAAQAIETVEADYRSQAVAARELAADQFGSGKVLTRMLDDIFSSSAGRSA